MWLAFRLRNWENVASFNMMCDVNFLVRIGSSFKERKTRIHPDDLPCSLLWWFWWILFSLRWQTVPLAEQIVVIFLIFVTDPPPIELHGSIIRKECRSRELFEIAYCFNHSQLRYHIYRQLIPVMPNLYPTSYIIHVNVYIHTRYCLQSCWPRNDYVPRWCVDHSLAQTSLVGTLPWWYGFRRWLVS